MFVSYVREDQKAAMRLYKELESIPDVEPWIDHEDLLPGRKWRPAVRKAIRESRFFLALLSSRAVGKRGFFQTELNAALEILEEFPEDQIFLIPVRLDDCHLPREELREIQYVDLFPDWDPGFSRLRKSLVDTRAANTVKEVAPSGYEYRCGIVDLDTGLTNIPRIAERLNTIQKFFHFTSPKISIPIEDALSTLQGRKNLEPNSISTDLYDNIQYLNVDFVVCVTRYPLAFREGSLIKFNYFSGPSPVNERFMFISTHQLYDFTKQANRTFEKGLVYIMIGQLIVYFTTLGYHEETKECVMDFCRKRGDMVHGLKRMRLCPGCLPQIKEPKLKHAITAILADDFQL